MIKPYAYSVINFECRAPDDCVEYEEIITAADFDSMPNKQKYIDNKMCSALFELPDGFVLVPVEPTTSMIGAWDDAFETTVFTPNEKQNSAWEAAYKAMIKAALEV